MLTQAEKRAIVETTDDYENYRMGYVDAHGQEHL